MTVRESQFGTRITRRVVALFMVCALIPVGAALLLAYDGVQNALIDERTSLLRGSAAHYGSSLIDRLGFAEAMARIALSDVAARRSPQGAAFEGYFRAAMTLDAAGARALFGAAARPLDAPAGVERALVVVPSPQQPSSVWLVVRGGASGARIALELEPAFLWGNADELPYLTDICVLAPDRKPLYCSRPVSGSAFDTVAERLSAQSRGEAAWNEDGRRFLAGYGEIFLRGRYGADSWIVVAAQPEGHALAPIQAMRRVVLPVVALGLLVAALLGLVQVRRTLGPLKELSDATSRIALQDFSVRVGVERDDEFGALARAFNTMSTHLGRQFTALLAHAEIDAVILSNVALPEVARIVLKRVAELARAERHLVLLAEPGPPGRYRLYGGLPSVFSGTPSEDGLPVSIPESDAQFLLAAPGGRRFGAADPALPVWLKHVPGRLFVLPISLGRRLAGAIVLGHEGERERAAEETSILSKLADRVAVALATANRDLELQRRAHYDALTQLPNRLLGMEELGRAVAAAERHGRELAVLFIDLDGFSDVNDSLGHEAGDQMLAQAAQRLRRWVRKSDVVARLGGDEFAVVLTELGQMTDAAIAARHLVAALSEPFPVAGASAFVSASAGIALYPADGRNAEELLRHADLAMYKAKQDGRGQVVFFEASMNREVRERVEAERELRDALEKGEFELHYQPQQEIGTGRILGAEALIRWRHPVRGLVAPAEFIAYAEASGLIEPIGQWVLETACAQYMAWQAQGVPLERMSVNVSPRQFRRPGLAALVGDALRAHGMPARALHLEITESALLNDEPAANANLAKLYQLGTRLELDDFGSGYSSLARLQRLPVAGVKLDQAFIAPIERSFSAQAVVRAAIEMAHALGKYVVAEGVETHGQHALLSVMACDLIQGYHLSPALPAARLAELVREASARGALA
jgi:diguanylate cyclase (GGDEF)-like protein